MQLILVEWMKAQTNEHCIVEMTWRAGDCLQLLARPSSEDRSLDLLSSVSSKDQGWVGRHEGQLNTQTLRLSSADSLQDDTPLAKDPLHPLQKMRKPEEASGTEPQFLFRGVEVRDAQDAIGSPPTSALHKRSFRVSAAPLSPASRQEEKQGFQRRLLQREAALKAPGIKKSGEPSQ